MQVKQEFVVARPRPAVWDYFGQIEKVTLCMPGASLVEPAVGKQVKFKMNVKLGPITAAFLGDAEIERDDNTFRGTIRGSGRDTRGNSRTKGALDYELMEEQEGRATGVRISAEFSLTGALAQFSRATVVQDLATRLTEEFAKNVEAALTPDLADATGRSSDVPRQRENPPAPQPSEIRAGSLVGSILWMRIRAWMQRLFGRG